MDIAPESLVEEIDILSRRKDDVVFGVYSIKDWFINSHIRKWTETGMNVLQDEGVWVTPASFKLATYVVNNFSRYTFTGSESALVFLDNCIITIFVARGKITVEFIGEPNSVIQARNTFDTNFKKAENLIQWVYNTRGATISVPLNFKKAIPSAYPWINGSLEDFFDDYLNSPACILILIGPPGTGKTTFIKNLIKRSGADAKVAYESAVISSDGFFADFIEDDTRFLIMEDADNFLRSRQDGNDMMHKFLNVSDGLISAADKKLVFSTNLPSIRDIDPALTRTGRCYAIVEFRPLDLEEAKIVLKDAGHGHIPENQDKMTLAEILSEQRSSELSNQKMGFI